MSHRERIEQNGYYAFSLSRSSDANATTPIEAKYTAIVLCTQGEATIECNMENYTLHAGDCLCVGNVIYKSTVHMSDDFKARVLISKSAFALDTVVGIPMGFMEMIHTRPCVNITDAGTLALLCNYIDNLDLLQHMQLGNRHKELVVLTFRSIVLLMAMLRGSNSSDLGKMVYGQGDIYFRNFIELIDDHVKQEHEVAFYASKLNITPKYLSEVCKLKSGHKAKEIISSFLISKIKQEMVVSGKSIKTIAYEYGFADQSSMGKFFSKMTGQAPGDFRKGATKP